MAWLMMSSISTSLVDNACKPVGVANLPNARQKLVVNEADVLVSHELVEQFALPIARMALDQCEKSQFAVIVLDCVEATSLKFVELFHVDLRQALIISAQRASPSACSSAPHLIESHM